MNENKDVKMQNEAKEAFELLDKVNELLRFHYDYHKHLTTLSAGSILIIIAILKGIFKEPKGIIIVLSSIVCFVLSLACSLIVMSMIEKITAHIIEMHAAYIKGNLKKMKESIDSASSAGDRIDVIDWFNRIFFFLGMAVLVLFAFINFL